MLADRVRMGRVSKDIYPPYIYNYGEQDGEFNVLSGESLVTFESDRIQITTITGANTEVSIVTMKEYDLTDWNYVRLVGNMNTSIYNPAFKIQVILGDGTVVSESYNLTNTGGVDGVVDVSQLSGEYYIKIYFGYPSMVSYDISIYQIVFIKL